MKHNKNNPSPSADSFFDEPENMRIIRRGIRQIEKGECTSYTAEELIQMLGVNI